MSLQATFTGKRYDAGAPTAHMIDVIDIAHSLSLQCRFLGHCKHHYSVAQHSLYVAKVVAHALREKPLPPKQQANYQLAALLHDGGETYLGDVPRPLKLRLRDYGPLETLAQSAVYQRFHVDYARDVRTLTEEADDWLLWHEWVDLMTANPVDFDLKRPKSQMLRISPGLFRWQPEEAETAFLEAYNRLTAGDPLLDVSA